jgi:hypothetical protein
LVLLPARAGVKAGDDGQQNEKDDGQKGQKDDGQQGQKDDGQKNQKDDGQQNQNDDGQQGQKDDGQRNQAVVKEVKAAGRAIVVSVRREGKDVEKAYDLAQDAAVVLAGKPANVADLKAGTRIVLRLSKDKKTVVGIKGV